MGVLARCGGLMDNGLDTGKRNELPSLRTLNPSLLVRRLVFVILPIRSVGFGFPPVESIVKVPKSPC